MVLGGLARCKQLSSNRKWLLYSIQAFCDQLYFQAKFPRDFVLQIVKQWLVNILDERVGHVCANQLQWLHRRPDDLEMCQTSLHDDYVILRRSTT